MSTQHAIFAWGVALAGAYLLGSIPFGLLIGKAKGVDIRESGSGNIGATNAMRVLGKPAGLLCFVLDVLKGALPVVASGMYFSLLASPDVPAATALLWMLVGLTAVIGHMFPIFLRFKGGKGVATGFGMLAAFFPITTYPAIGALVLWIVVMKTTRYVSVASCAAAASIPLLIIAWLSVLGGPAQLAAAWPFVLMTVLLAGFVVFKHRSNLARVRAGTENKVGAPKSSG
jgi:glycerol-3-phosphate acyltransferase PlsY